MNQNSSACLIFRNTNNEMMEILSPQFKDKVTGEIVPEILFNYFLWNFGIHRKVSKEGRWDAKSKNIQKN